jgi:GNAT superfamily N-acetyltransferase
MPLDAAEVEREWESSWGNPVVSVDREYTPADVVGRAWVSDEGEVRGIVTWSADGDRAEIVTVEARAPGQHIGGRLIDGAEAQLKDLGVRRVRVVTTNDNLRAQAFYARRGYRLLRVHLDAMDRVRARKPAVPLHGTDGIPLRDMLEFEKEL